jgi:hypothetical protein
LIFFHPFDTKDSWRVIVDFSDQLTRHLYPIQFKKKKEINKQEELSKVQDSFWSIKKEGGRKERGTHTGCRHVEAMFWVKQRDQKACWNRWSLVYFMDSTGVFRFRYFFCLFVCCLFCCCCVFEMRILLHSALTPPLFCYDNVTTLDAFKNYVHDDYGVPIPYQRFTVDGWTSFPIFFFFFFFGCCYFWNKKKLTSRHFDGLGVELNEAKFEELSSSTEPVSVNMTVDLAGGGVVTFNTGSFECKSRVCCVYGGVDGKWQQVQCCCVHGKCNI